MGDCYKSRHWTIIALVVLLLLPMQPSIRAEGRTTSSDVNYHMNVGEPTEISSIFSAPGEDLHLELNFSAGSLWLEFTCECNNITVTLTDSDGIVNTPTISSATKIVLDHNVSAGMGELVVVNNGDSVQTIEVNAILPIGHLSVMDNADEITPPNDISEVAFAEENRFSNVEFEQHRSEENTTKNPTWFNGSIMSANDSDALRFNSTTGDIFEFILMETTVDLKVTAWGRSTSLREIGVLFETMTNTSINSDHLFVKYVEVLEGEELWLEIESESIHGYWSLQFARHLPNEESEKGEYLGKDGPPPGFDFAINEDSKLIFETEGWIGETDEDCLALLVPAEEVHLMHTLASRTVTLTDNQNGSSVDFAIHVYSGSSWTLMSDLSIMDESISNGTQLNVASTSIPSGTTWIRFCLNSNSTTYWGLSIDLEVIQDTPGGVPLSELDAQSNWQQWIEEVENSASLDIEVYDFQDTYWFSTEGWPESKFFTRFTCINGGTRPLFIEVVEINWLDRSKNTSANITLQPGDSEDITLSVGPGTHLVIVTDFNLSQQPANWSWGDMEMSSDGEYSLKLNILRTDVGKEPWFPPDEIALTASKWFIAVIGFSFCLPFAYIVIIQRARKRNALDLIGKQNRLSVLRDILSRGDIAEARESVEENLQLISILSWEEGIGVWGEPAMQYNTGELDLAVWTLDERIASKGGLPFVLGIHISEGVWENTGLRIEAPEGSLWTVVDVKPKLLYRDDEIFLDQLNKGSRTFIQIEITGNGSGIELALSGVVDSNPCGIKTNKEMLIDCWNEEE
jgi:hypothetical protein